MKKTCSTLGHTKFDTRAIFETVLMEAYNTNCMPNFDLYGHLDRQSEMSSVSAHGTLYSWAGQLCIYRDMRTI